MTPDKIITISDYYYKKTEIDTMMNGKANTSHTHTTSEITDFPVIPDVSNYIQKSSTSGLVKNDGSIDTTSYLSSLPSHTHNTWTKTSLWTNGDNYAILWVNKDIRLCHLKYYQKDVSVSTSEKTLHTKLIPTSYRPSYTVMTGCYNPHVSVGAAKTGNIICVSDSSATRTVNCNLMWNY